MEIEPFELERFFARHEFTAPYTLTSSDCEPLSLSRALELADEEGLAMWENLGLGYTEYEGLSPLRREIASLYGSVGPEQVQVAAPVECIFLAANAMLRRGDHVVCTHPGYQALHEVAVALGCEVARWEPVEEEGWRYDVGRLAELIRPNTKAVIVNFPHNPTGYLPPASDFERIVEIAGERGAYLLSDEMYRFLELEPAARLPAACDVYEKAVSLSGMSKCLGMPGVRIGWLATRDSGLMERIRVLRDYTTICSSAPAEVLAFIGLKAREAIVGGNLDRIKRNLEVLDRFFERFDGIFDWVRPSGGTVAFPRIRTGDSPVFCSEVLDRTGILLVPSTIFRYGHSHFRLGFGREDVPRVLEMLADYLECR